MIGWFLNLSTRSKLSLSLGALVFLLAAAALMAFSSVRAICDGFAVATDLMQVRNNVNGERVAILTALLQSDEGERQIALNEVRDRSNENDDILRRLDRHYQRYGDFRGQFKALASLRADQMQTRDTQVLSAIRDGKLDEAKALTFGIQNDRYYKMRAIARELTKASEDGARRRAARLEWTFGLFTVGAGLFGLLMVSFLNRIIAAPLDQLSKVADQIAHGDLSFDLPVTGRSDEVGRLVQTFRRMSRSLKVLAGRATQIAAGDLSVTVTPQSADDVLGNAFATMTAKLREVMQELLDAVNILASGTNAIMTSTTQLAASASESASAVTQTTTTVEEVKQTSQLASQKGKYVAASAHRAAEISQSGTKSVEATIGGMHRIREQMELIADGIVKLSEQSQAIGEIITAVDDLAQQSKLLAVNASIEAAKAGEQGEGFAVVAQEVKRLAEQSKQATAQVRTILSDIQKATGVAVMATEQGTKAVEAGVIQSQLTGDSIKSLSDAMTEAAEAAIQIAATSQEQFVGMDQVALAMHSIKTASKQAVASTRQAETAAQNLDQFGRKLKTLVEHFKL